MSRRAPKVDPGHPLGTYAPGSPPGVDVQLEPGGRWYVIVAQCLDATRLGAIDGSGIITRSPKVIVHATRHRAER